MDNVYLVVDKDTIDLNTNVNIEAFSTKEKAEAYADKLIDESYENEKDFFEEFEVDKDNHCYGAYDYESNDHYIYIINSVVN